MAETLVRDYTRDWLRMQGDPRRVRRAKREELAALFVAKLYEELAEYQESLDVAELSDLVAVAFACAWSLHEVVAGDLMHMEAKKVEERGEFRFHFVLERNPTDSRQDGSE